MRPNLMKSLTFFATLVPAAPVMAHAEVTGQNALQMAAHNLVHALQAHPWLPFAAGVAILVISAIARMNHRES